MGFFLAHLAEGGNALEVTDDTGEVVQIGAAALGAHGEGVLGNVPTLVADSVAPLRDSTL